MRSLVKGILFGCGSMLAVGIVIVAGIALVGVGMSGEGGGEEEASGPGSSRDEPVPMNEPAEIGDVVWTVTNVESTTQLSDSIESMQGNFVIVDLSFTNNSDEAVTLDSGSLAIVDSEGQVNEASTDASTIVDPNMNLFLNEVNPGVTEEARVAFDVAPNAEGMVLRANDAGLMSENYTFISLGF